MFLSEKEIHRRERSPPILDWVIKERAMTLENAIKKS